MAGNYHRIVLGIIIYTFLHGSSLTAAEGKLDIKSPSKLTQFKSMNSYFVNLQIQAQPKLFATSAIGLSIDQEWDVMPSTIYQLIYARTSSIHLLELMIKHGKFW